jgi:hypothetical protein
MLPINLMLFIITIMLRSLLWLSLILLAGGAYIIKSNHPELAETRQKIEKILGLGYPPVDFAALKQELAVKLNEERTKTKLPPVAEEPELQQWIDNLDDKNLSANFDALIDRACDDLPRYPALVATLVSGKDQQDLVKELLDFMAESSNKQQLSHWAMRSVPSTSNPKAMLIAGQKLLDLTPEHLTERKASTFFSVCPHCQNPDSYKVPHGQQTISMDCAKCQRCIGRVACDSQGRFRYLNEFLTGYEPPAMFPEEVEPLYTLYTIWKSVLTNCIYTEDSDERMPKRDVWQTALETLNRGRGDCEDTSILLTDWLIKRNISARVAIGRYGDIGGHAWCVAKVDNIDYLLESTAGKPDSNHPPYAADVGDRYIPEVLFDRDAIYIRNSTKAKWDGDYWSNKTWIKVQPRMMFQPVKTGYTAYVAPPPESLFRQAPSPIYTSTAPVKASDPLLSAHFRGLKAIPTGAADWLISNASIYMEPKPKGPEYLTEVEGIRPKRR